MKTYLRAVLYTVLLSLLFFSKAEAASCPAGIQYYSGDSAYFVSQVVPTSMEAGQSYYVSVTFCNNGTTTWTYQAPPAGAGYIRLGTYPTDTTPWGINRVDLSAGDSIAPGSTKTFSFTIVAPTTTAPSVTNNFQFGMLREGVARFGAGAVELATSYYTPVITVQNTPNVAPVFVDANGPAAFSFTNFAGANIFNETYVEAGGTHTLWIPNSTQMTTIAARASAMNLKYLRIPLVIPPATTSSEYVSAAWYNPVAGYTANQTNVNAVIAAATTALNTANSYGLKVILTLDGYTEYDAACNTNGLWKKSFDAVQANAATIISALSSNSALYAWDILNEPLWNAYAYGCLAVAPSTLDRGTQTPLLALPSGSGTVQSIAEVVEAVHAMYNVVRANDPNNHPTTVGEGTAAYVHYWSDISSFASPHLYVSPQSDIITPQVTANTGQVAALQFTEFTGAPTTGNTWTMTDAAIQSQLPGIIAATIGVWKMEAIGTNSVPLPLVMGEYGLGLDGGTLNTAAAQSIYYSLNLGALSSASQAVYTSVNLGGLFWSLQSTPPTPTTSNLDFSLITSTGTYSAGSAYCVVAKALGASPSGC